MWSRSTSLDFGILSFSAKETTYICFFPPCGNTYPIPHVHTPKETCGICQSKRHNYELSLGFPSSLNLKYEEWSFTVLILSTQEKVTVKMKSYPTIATLAAAAMSQAAIQYSSVASIYAMHIDLHQASVKFTLCDNTYPINKCVSPKHTLFVLDVPVAPNNPNSIAIWIVEKKSSLAGNVIQLYRAHLENSEKDMSLVENHQMEQIQFFFY
ncbi:hypothetical protein RFI_19334 [Reticulomyxa filosa]|uniref:Uncharacterized protein n=1 Tax=Reticulomyxa filosa TaxID=46433 RepID=X6MWG6_RETFI|nr:hypothetical protein RFI_19334 [Reticulomyxa filosa]|eukprot:ETO17971.1 hypothetical protein RFI_19334 [Reticulomyxa filosa]